MILDILTYPDTFLSKPTSPVENIDGPLRELIEDMAETMFNAPGVGLAAIQVGQGKRLFVYDTSEQGKQRSYDVLINPRIVERQGRIVSENEGCLSVPDYRSDVKRFEKILVEGFDREGKPLRFEAEGFPAIVFQHEIDHLDGKLFIDRISALKRQLFKKRVRKAMNKQ